MNRHDYHKNEKYGDYGVGYQILTKSSFDEVEVRLVLNLLDRRSQHRGPGLLAIDGGANIGVHSIEWARHMSGWGEVISFEPQEKIFYALCGNAAINNCFNIAVRNAALGSESGMIDVPLIDYTTPASYGSLELRRSSDNEHIGQQPGYGRGNYINMVSIDDLMLPRLDFIKLDIEGMELEALLGAQKTIANFRPIMLIEAIKSNMTPISDFLKEAGYKTFPAGPNILAVHEFDEVACEIQVVDDWSIVSV